MSNSNNALTYPPDTFNRELGKLLLREEVFSLGCVAMFGIVFFINIITIIIIIHFATFELLDDLPIVLIGFIVISSVICAIFFHYCTRHYRYWYENGFIEIKWRKRIIMYDQTTCTWSEESEDWTSQIHDRNIIIKKHFKVKKWTFSIFPNEEIGGGKFVFTFDNQRIENPNYEFYNTIRNKIEAITANLEKK
ncbi:MAG: hypothetical protein LBT09_00815 [Planctomycetaceae bacterium]|jgi:hypothetical protein|nr:hypothetical protein [Planctomycetaceae bacterium]